MFRWCFFLVLFFPVIVLGKIYPGGTPLSDNNYFIYKTSDYFLIFDKQYKKMFPLLRDKVEFYLDRAQRVQQRKLDEPLVFIFLSDKSQVSNALASLFPYFQNVFHPVGLDAKDAMASPYWLDTVLEHEITHVFQLSHTAFPPFLRRLLKSPSGFISRLFLNVYPNQTLPRFIVEGDAVLKESMIQKGGRLYSGFARAFVFSQIKKYRHLPSSFSKLLINETRYPHVGIEKYLHGGYLSLFLLNKYSHRSLIDFFKFNSRNEFITGFKLSFFNVPALMRQFKTSFDGIVRMYLDFYGNRAGLQRSSSKRALFKSASCHPFNDLGDHVFFFTTNAQTRSFIRIYNKRSKKWIRKRTSLLPGKLFRLNGRYYSRASHPNSAVSIVYSLFSENAFPYNKFFNSKYMEDIRGKSFLHIDSRNTMDGFKLFLNNRFYSYIHSNALFDVQKNIYYFKQENSLRTLYKNKIPIFSYYGFYGHLIDIGKDGAVYFIASTPFGSSIFKYKDRQVIRVVASDTVIQAKKINSEEFIACEITPTNYVYKIIPIEERAEHPDFYQYNFEIAESQRSSTPYNQFEKIKPNQSNPDSENNQDLLDDLDKNWDVYRDAEQTRRLAYNKSSPLKYKKYNSLTNISYSSMNQDVQFSFYPYIDVKYRIQLVFTDYLQKNLLLLNYINDNIKNMTAFVSYQNFIYRLIWGVSYQLSIIKKKQYHDRTLTTPTFPDLFDFIQADKKYHSGFLELSLPLFQRGYWSSLVNSRQGLSMITYSQNTQGGENQTTKIGLVSQWSGSWNLSYTRRYPLAYLPHRSWDLHVLSTYVQGINTDLYDLKWKAQSSMLSHIGFQFYAGPILGHVESFNKRSIHIGLPPESWRLPRKKESNLLPISSMQVTLFPSTSFFAKSVSFGSLKLLKPIYTPLFTKYVLSLRYIVPSVTGHYVILRDFANAPDKPFLPSAQMAHFVAWNVGLEIQFLIDYKQPFHFIISAGQRIPVSIPRFSSNSIRDISLNFYAKSSF